MNLGGTIRSVVEQKGSFVWSITPDATVLDAIQLMADKNIGALVVINAGELLGIVSERDYTRKVVLRGKSSKDTRVREIMSSPPIVVHPDESVEDCLRMMTANRIRHLPVLDGTSVRGVVSIGDLVKSVSAQKSAIIDHLEHYIAGGYPG